MKLGKKTYVLWFINVRIKHEVNPLTPPTSSRPRRDQIKQIETQLTAKLPQRLSLHALSLTENAHHIPQPWLNRLFVHIVLRNYLRR